MEKFISIPKLFEIQVIKTPNAPALFFEGKILNYHELNIKANQLAVHLNNSGIEPKSKIALLFDRSFASIISIIAILKLRCTYIPLEPSYPSERIKNMLKDSNAEYIISDMPSSPSIADKNIQWLKYNLQIFENSHHAVENPDLIQKPDDSVYILFTSGSSGKPKGIEMPHKAVSNLIQWQIKQPFPYPNTNTLQFSPYGFDISFQEIFFTLSTGGTVVLVSENTRRSPHDLLYLIEKNQVHNLFVTPTVLLELCLAAKQTQIFPQSLNTIATAGEQLVISQEIKEFFTKIADCRLVNQYGPTETHITNSYLLDMDPHTWSELPLIGPAIDNCQTIALDEYDQPVGLGEIGQLCASGICLANGYTNNPKKTKELFTQHPALGRIYKTGDIVRVMPGGKFEFLGRNDEQIKIRGHRVEPAEIRYTLLNHPDILESVIRPLKNDAKSIQLIIAYLVTKNQKKIAVDELRKYLLQTLPEYMIPNLFHFLPQLPISVNGKIDFDKLPTLELTRPTLGKEYQEPTTSTQKILCRILETHLKIKPIGISDNFFDLGAHSLLLIRIANQINKEFNISLPFQDLFTSPTIIKLEKTIQSNYSSISDTNSLLEISRPKKSIIPLSYSQKRLWYLQRLNPNSPAYNLPVAFHLKGQLDIPILEQSLKKLISRHEPLRSYFPIKHNLPLQKLEESSNFVLSHIDLRSHPRDKNYDNALELARIEICQPFNLSEPFLCKSSIIQLTKDSYIFLNIFHHTIFDDWSYYIFTEELSTIYNALNNDLKPKLEKLQFHFSDYSLYEKDQLIDRNLSHPLNFWTVKLNNASPILKFPTDHPRPKKQSFTGDELSIILNQEEVTALRRLGQQHNTTPFIILLSAYKILLHQFCQQDDITVGIPFANRSLTNTEKLIGFFVNTLPIHSKINTKDFFSSFLIETRNNVFEAIEYQSVPLDQIVEQLSPERSLAYSPIFQTMINWHNENENDLKFENLHSKYIHIQSNVSMFDLTVFLEEKINNEIECNFQYNTDLFTKTTIKYWQKYYKKIIKSILQNPDEKISSLMGLTPEDQNNLIFQWNNTDRKYNRRKDIAQLFELQVKKTPDKTAVSFEGKSFSYKALNEKANRLAHHLLAINTIDNPSVAFLLERSTKSIVTMLACIKLGWAFIPLDITNPQNRLNMMLQDANPSILVTESKHINNLDKTPLDVVLLDQNRDKILSDCEKNLDRAIATDCPAYFMYTSGSTGKPKAVIISQQAIKRLVLNTNYIDITTKDVIAQVSNTSFDAASFEIWGALLNGAKLVIVPTEISLSPDKFAEKLKEDNISILFLTTALFNFLASENPKMLAGLRYFLTGGQEISIKWVHEIIKNGKPEHFIHVYGPTENTTFSTFYPIQNQESASSNMIPIGKPISNSLLYILNRDLQPVPQGVIGEIYLGGEGLAIGYHNNSKLTSESFLNIEIEKGKPIRLYKTGDFGKYLTTGNVNFLGRQDKQIKMRGFRVELEEIEFVLNQHKNIKDCKVLLNKEEPENHSLIAYIIPYQNKNISLDSVKDYLSNILPDYMIPLHYIYLDKFQITPNGKLDFTALPKPNYAPHEILIKQSNTEKRLKYLWENLLNIENPSLDENFFALGGHSLLVAKMFANITTMFKINLRLAVLFENPTIRSLAKIIDQKIPQPESHITLLRKGKGIPILICAAPQGNVISFYDLIKNIQFENPIYGLQFSMYSEEELKEFEVHSLAKIISEEILKKIPNGPYILGGHSFGGVIAYEIAQQLESIGKQIDLIFLLDTFGPNYPKMSMKQAQNLKISRFRYLLSYDGELWKRYINKVSHYLINSTKNILNQISQKPPRILLINPMKDYYVPDYQGKVLLIRAQEEKTKYLDATLGWRDAVKGELFIEFVTGQHLSIIRAKGAFKIAKILETHLKN